MKSQLSGMSCEVVVSGSFVSSRLLTPIHKADMMTKILFLSSFPQSLFLLTPLDPTSLPRAQRAGAKSLPNAPEKDEESKVSSDPLLTNPVTVKHRKIQNNRFQ